jgi:hypothetical protein
VASLGVCGISIRPPIASPRHRSAIVEDFGDAAGTAPPSELNTKRMLRQFAEIRFPKFLQDLLWPHILTALWRNGGGMAEQSDHSTSAAGQRDGAAPPAGDTAGRLECDVVMKGGITSGIVYPKLIVELSKKYRFRQIGGASAGAIAATMTAAAQAGQLKLESAGASDAEAASVTKAARGERLEGDSGSTKPFDVLAGIPIDLASNIAHLFQPSPSTTAAYDVLMAFLKPGRSTGLKLLAAVGLIIRHGIGWFLLATLVAMIPAVSFVVALLGAPHAAAQWQAIGRALLVWLPVALLIGVVAASVQLGRSSLNAIIGNGFGLCDGHTPRPGAPIDPLTDWMEEKLRELAGPLADPDDLANGETDRPVCFGDLWGKKATDAYGDALKGVDDGELAYLTPTHRREMRDARQVDCLVITTDLSHQRPYQFPFDTAEFFCCAKCLDKYFPDSVVGHMMKKSRLVPDSEVPCGKPECSIHSGEPLHYMPLAPDVPLVMAARLSLSFPGLISAVPFQAVDRTRIAAKQGIVTVWFSDGGISSNFPMRLFDAAWPLRPTFGINLAKPHPDYPEMVWRARPGQSGRFLRYTAISSLGGFAGAIFNSARNWADSTQIAMPGFRDRIVEVRQRDDEGGMNLQMPDDIIAGLANRGAEAGLNILNGNGKPDDDPDKLWPFNFQAHRWMRYRSAMASVDELLSGMHAAWTAREDSQEAFLASDQPPSGFRFPTYPPGANDHEATAKVMQLAQELEDLGHPALGVETPDGVKNVPHPEPELRLTPPL